MHKPHSSSNNQWFKHSGLSRSLFGLSCAEAISNIVPVNRLIVIVYYAAYVCCVEHSVVQEG